MHISGQPALWAKGRGRAVALKPRKSLFSLRGRELWGKQKQPGASNMMFVKQSDFKLHWSSPSAAALIQHSPSPQQAACLPSALRTSTRTVPSGSRAQPWPAAPKPTSRAKQDLPEPEASKGHPAARGLPLQVTALPLVQIQEGVSVKVAVPCALKREQLTRQLVH